MKSKNISYAILITLVLSISGCLGGGGSTGTSGSGNGLVITGIRSDFADVYAEDLTMIAVDFENRGGYMAKNVQGFLLREGAFTKETSHYDGVDPQSSVNIEKPLQDVYSGEEFYWDVKAPNVMQPRTEEVQARIQYDYKTDAYATLHFVPQEIVREQGTEPFSMDQYTSSSPVAISIEATNPIIIRETDEDTKTVRINLIFSNVGGGNVRSKTVFGDDTVLGQCTKADGCIDKILISTSGGGCTFTAETTDPSIDLLADGSIKVLGIKLIQDSQGRKSFSWTFDITEKTAATSCQLRVNADYTYEVDSSVLPVNILPVDT